MGDTYALMTKAAMLFQKNLQSPETHAALKKLTPKKGLMSTLLMRQDAPLPIFLMFDMMFVALRKTSRSPAAFATPAQSIYSK
jgi:hypothetical protein